MNFPQSLQRKLFFFCFLLVCLSSFAQADLFFTIKVLSNGMPISVDSIKVENLTSRSSFSLHSLPQTDSFYINLSRAKLERDPSGVSRLVEGAEGEWVCVETKPGNLILKTIATQKTPSYLRILNMQGRCVHNEPIKRNRFVLYPLILLRSHLETKSCFLSFCKTNDLRLQNLL